MARFVVLEHRWEGVHWDFMLEVGAVLRTWALEEPPDSAGAVSAKPLGDHRRVYLDYEGPVSGDRGTVRRWDRGEYEWIEEGGQRAVLRLKGTRLQGEARLERREGTTGWVYQWLPGQRGDVGG